MNLLRLVPHSSLTWRPVRRTHLFHAGVAVFLLAVTLITDWSSLTVRSLVTSFLLLVCLPLASVHPVPGLLVSLPLMLVALAQPEPMSLAVLAVPWFLCAMTLARGYPRALVYPAALGSIAWFVIFSGTTSQGLRPALIASGVASIPCLVGGETVRHHRERLQRSERERAERLRRQQRLVTSELHDTVVRDLSHAVMKAEQVRLADPHAPHMEDLGDLTASVRRAVEQLRTSLRTMHDAGEEGMDVLASCPPRPLEEVIAEARTTLAARRIDLEVEGLGALDAPEVGPGMRQQLVRVLSELVTNMTKYATLGGSARLVLDGDAATIEAMATNTFDPRAHQSGDMSSGLGVVGARRRIESLGGSLSATSTADRWTVTLSVPLTVGAR